MGQADATIAREFGEQPSFTQLTQTMRDGLRSKFIYASGETRVLAACFSALIAESQRVGNIQIAEQIGSGSFAIVHKGYRLDKNGHPGQAVAVKAVTRNKLTPKLLENLESEIKLLKGIKHRNIVQLVDCLKTEAHIYLIMAYCSAGDLSYYIKKRGQVEALKASMYAKAPPPFPHPPEGGLNEVVVRSFLGQLSDAIKFLRTQNIIHRDIKPQNLLLSPYDEVQLSESAYGHLIPGVPVLQVADFGFARFLPQASMAETLCGSPLYMAPEILRYEKYDAKADLWSCGAVLYEMATGRPPFRAQNHVELLRRIEKGEDRIKFPEDKTPSSREPDAKPVVVTPVPEDIKALIKKLLKRNPLERMPFDDFFQDAETVARSGAASGLLPATPVSSDNPSVSSSIARMQPSVAESPINQKSKYIESLAATQAPIEKEEGAFVRKSATSNSTAADTPAQPERPSSSGKKSAFTPKYVVGTSANRTTPPLTVETEIKRKDFAAPQSPGPAVSEKRKPDLLSESANGNDSVLAKEYVVIDKGPIAINALADELAAQDSRPSVLERRASKGFLSKPLIGANVPSSAPLSPSPSPYPPAVSNTGVPSNLTNPTHDLAGPPPFALSPSKLGNQPYSTSPQSRHTYPTSLAAAGRPSSYTGSHLANMVNIPSNTIAKALNLASLKLFGNPADGILLRKPSSRTRKPIPKIAEALDPVELALITELEDLGQKATVIFDFADSKLLKIISSSSPLSGTPANGSPFARKSPSPSGSSLEISVQEAQNAADALILYIKALAFLQRGIERAKAFWDVKTRQFAAGSNEALTASAEFNEAVQWLRRRFNDCYEKADFVKSRIEDGSANLQPASSNADKLIYDRALEMSRAAAVNELMGEATADCEVAYETALYMLFAILDDSLNDHEPIKEEDKLTVNKFVSSIQGRLSALRKRMIAT